MVLIAAVRDCPGCLVPDVGSVLPLVAVLISIFGMVAVPSLLVLATVLAVRDRRIPVWLLPAAALAFGLMASPVVILWWRVDRPSIALLLGFAAFAVPLAAAWARRFDLAGWNLVGSAAPAVLWWSFFVVEDIVADDVSYEPAIAIWLATSVALLLAGLAGIAFGDRTPAPAPRRPRNEPDPGRAVALAHALLNVARIGPFDLPNLLSLGVAAAIGLIIGFISLSNGMPVLATAIVAIGVSVAVATDLYYRVLPDRMARAMATHAFVASWEVARFRRTAGSRIPWTAGSARTWLASHPESDANRWVRPEFLLWTGNIGEAYEVISRMPATTADERFERLALQTYADHVSGAPVDLREFRAAASTIGDPGSDERLRALAQVALAESRELLAQGDAGWLAPMLRVQELLGPQSLQILRSDTWRMRLAGISVVGLSALGIVVVVALAIGQG